jgi:choline transporter-like protein 2/4/5
MIRLVFEFYANQVRKGNPDNKCIKCCLCLTGYCLYCVEKCIKFITKNAYIQVALSNGYFCKSAWRAFALILSNAGRFGATATIGSIYQFFGTMAIGSMTGFSAYLILG